MGTDQITRVLVVDDERTVLDPLAEFLQDFGFEVDTAETSEDALELLSKDIYHVAIVDLRLPGLSGEEFILTAHEQYPTLQFLIYTGSLDFSLTPELIQIGLTKKQLLYKPLQSLHTLVDSVKQCAEKNRGY